MLSRELCIAVGGSLGLGLGGPADYSLSTPAPAQWSGVPVLAKTGEIVNTDVGDLSKYENIHDYNK